MNCFKRIFSMLLIMTMLFGLISISSVSANDKPGYLESLCISTGGKAKTLELTWNKAQYAKGYQIYRSSSGKTGTYQKIAVVKDTSYIDKNLSASTPYYYKVRAYAKQGDKYTFGAFVKADLSTQITKSFAQKKLQAAYKVADYWLSPALKNCDLSVSVPADKNANVECYHPVKSDKFKTKDQLITYLCKYFSWQFVSEAVETIYIEKDGKLYMGEVGYGDGASHNYNNDRVDYIWQKDGYATVLVIEEHEGYEGKMEIPYPHGLYYENGRWVFGEEDGIRSYGRLNYWNFLEK